jgi:hypothetical protein
MQEVFFTVLVVGGVLCLWMSIAHDSRWVQGRFERTERTLTDRRHQGKQKAEPMAAIHWLMKSRVRAAATGLFFLACAVSFFAPWSQR